MSLGTILLIVLVIALLGGFSGLGGGPFYGTGYAYTRYRAGLGFARQALNCQGSAPFKIAPSGLSPSLRVSNFIQISIAVERRLVTIL
jgi:hypothetical protein